MSTKLSSKQFQIPQGKKLRLAKRPTSIRALYKTKEEYKERLDEQVDQLRRWQDVLYADNRYSLLVIFQAMDAAGKDGVIKHVFSGVNPQGCQVYSFKQPSSEELDHDFLWRTTTRLPERGRIGVFNRSYYEEVLVVRVRPEFLEAQRLPAQVLNDPDLWEKRFESIRDHERHLHANGTIVLKFYLHLSKEEQRKRLLSRIDEPEKNWKVSLSDIEQRKLWKKYMTAYEECLSATTSKSAPWFVIPADDKKNARLIVASIVVENLRALKLQYPKLSPEHQKNLGHLRRLLES